MTYPLIYKNNNLLSRWYNLPYASHKYNYTNVNVSFSSPLSFFFNLSHINYLKNKIFVTETNTFYIKDTIDVSIKLKDNTERAVCWYS